MRLTAGARLGPYEVVAPLGAGGMGEVYKARDTRLDRTVALKVLAPDAARDDSFKARFEKEARAISALNHPHKRQVSSSGGVQPLWRQDSRELFYLDHRGMLMAVQVERSGPALFGVPRPLFKTPLNPSAHVSEYGVAPDGQRFLVLEPVGSAPPAFTFLLNWRPDSVGRVQ